MRRALEEKRFSIIDVVKILVGLIAAVAAVAGFAYAVMRLLDARDAYLYGEDEEQEPDEEEYMEDPDIAREFDA